MEEQDHQQTRDEFDHVLDAALAKYAAVEPRSALEERVLANLRGQAPQGTARGWWRWGLATAVAAVVVLVVGLGWRSAGPSRPVIANHPPATTGMPRTPEKQATNRDENAVQPRKRQSRPRPGAPARLDVVEAAAPRLEQFPSPRPLSEQEKMLLDYVNRFPNEVAMIAEAQTALKEREALLDKNRLQPGQNEPQVQEKVE